MAAWALFKSVWSLSSQLSLTGPLLRRPGQKRLWSRPEGWTQKSLGWVTKSWTGLSDFHFHFSLSCSPSLRPLPHPPNPHSPTVNSISSSTSGKFMEVGAETTMRTLLKKRSKNYLNLETLPHIHKHTVTLQGPSGSVAEPCRGPSISRRVTGLWLGHSCLKPSGLRRSPPAHGFHTFMLPWVSVSDKPRSSVVYSGSQYPPL